MAPKAKDKSKTAAAPPVAIEDLFTSLNRHIQRSELKQAVKVSDQVLKIAPGDADAIRCKVVALVKNDYIEEALSAIQEFSKKFSIDFSLLNAYCLYRQNKYDDALASLNNEEENPANMLLQAQILYRLGRMDACVDIYKELQKLKTPSLEINFVAALVSAGKASEVQKLLDSLRLKAADSFELAYNVACSLIDRNLFEDAEELLLKAQRVGRETLMNESLADDDIEIELAPIAVQLAYVQKIRGNNEDAFKSYTSIIKKNLADESSLAISINNLVALKGPKDVSEGLRKLDKLIEKGEGPSSFQLGRGLELKLSQKQKEAIYVNRLLLLLHANKLDQARELASALPGMFPHSILPVLLQAAVHIRENRANKAEEILLQFSSKFPEKSKVILLARAQVAAAAGHAQVAAESLQKIPEIQHKPATVATIVSLKERAGDIDGADAVFNSAIKWWSDAMTEDNKLDVIVQEAAAFKLRHGKKEEAASLYENIVKSHGTIEALVGLVETTAHTNVEKAESYEKQLKPLPGLKQIDVESLEKTSGAKQIESERDVSVAEAYEPKNKEKTKKKRKRKPRYPKGFDPANPGPPPDPERWLPKRERSSYRPKRKDKRAAQIRGSQGAVVKESADTSNSSKSKEDAHTKGNSQNASSTQSKVSSKSRKKSRK